MNTTKMQCRSRGTSNPKPCTASSKRQAWPETLNTHPTSFTLCACKVEGLTFVVCVLGWGLGFVLGAFDRARKPPELTLGNPPLCPYVPLGSLPGSVVLEWRLELSRLQRPRHAHPVRTGPDNDRQCFLSGRSFGECRCRATYWCSYPPHAPTWRVGDPVRRMQLSNYGLKQGTVSQLVTTEIMQGSILVNTRHGTGGITAGMLICENNWMPASQRGEMALRMKQSLLTQTLCPINARPQPL